MGRRFLLNWRPPGGEMLVFSAETKEIVYMCMLTTTLRLELARAATSARHVDCVIWVFVRGVRGRFPSRSVCGIGVEAVVVVCVFIDER